MDVPGPATAVLGPRFHALLARDHRAAFRDAVERAGWECHVCGLQIREWMEVDHLDGDHANNAPANLGCACPWCHRTRHPAALPNLVSFAWLPEMEPAHLSRFAALAVMVETARRQDAVRPPEDVMMSPLAGGFSARDLEVAIAQVDDELAKRHLLACQVVGTGDVAALVETAWRHPSARGAMANLRWVPRRDVMVITPAGHVTVTDRIGAALFAAIRDREAVDRVAVDLWTRLTAIDDAQ